jgi:uncharacterized protein
VQTYKPSRYNVLVPLTGGRVLAYNALSGGLALWQPDETALFDTITAPTSLDESDPTVQALEKGGYVVREQVDELGYIERQYRQHRYDPRRMILTIVPTMACNFGCDYCFQGAEKSAATMESPVQDAIVALLERVTPAINYFHVAWYGGEPLVREKVIESLSDRFIAHCDRHAITYDAMVVTNGYRLTPEVARSLYVRRVTGVQVTLDGPPDDHDQRRVLLSGGGTFDRIISNLKAWIDEVPLHVTIRVNIDSRNGSHIHDLIDYLVEAGLSGRKNLKIYFAPVEAITSACHTIASVTLTKSGYGQLEAELNRHAFEANLSSLPYPPRFRGSCAAVRPKGFVVLPDGEMHKCWNTVSWPEKRVGTIFDLDALNMDPQVLNWLHWSPLDNDACRHCALLPVCAGACAYKFLYPDDTLGEAAALPCPSWKYNIKERLLLRAEKMKFISPEDYDLAALRMVSAG